MRAPLPSRRSRHERPLGGGCVTGIGEPPRRPGPGLRGVRRSGGVPGPQLPRRAQLASRRRAGRRRGVWPGIRLVAPDRPGMGLSTFQPGRTLLDWPEDVTALAHSARDRALRRDGLVGRRALCGGVRGQTRRSRHGCRAALERRAARPLRDQPGAGRRGPRPDPPVPARARTGLARHEAQHRQLQQRPPPSCRHARLPAGRPLGARRVGPGRPGPGLRARVGAPGDRGVRPGLPDLRRPVGILTRRDPGPRADLGGVGRPDADRPATAPSSRATSPARRSPWSPERATSPCCPTRRRPSSRRWSAATAPIRRRGGTWGSHSGRIRWS